MRCFLLVIGCVAALGLAPVGAFADDTPTRPFVHEVTVAAPDILAIEVRDPPYRVGSLAKLPQPRPGTIGEWINEDGRWGLLVGRDRDHIRFEDAPPASYLDRKTVDQASGYRIDGGPKVVAVYRKSVPYDTGVNRGAGGETMRAASFKHYIYLKLDGKVPARTPMVVHWPRGLLPDTPFAFDPKVTRSISLHANQHGYGVADPAKMGFLSLWLPGGPNEGAVDFSAYGVNRFSLLDESGSEVFSGEITLRRGPTDPEMGNGLPAPTTEYASAMKPPGVVVAQEAGSEVLFTARGHGLKAGQRIRLSRFTNAFAALNGFHTVASVGGDGFRIKMPSWAQLPAVTTASGQFSPTYRANRAATFVYELNFDKWQAKPGRYRLFAPGLGVSDTFSVADDIWLQAARVSFGGLYNHRSGVALDGRFGYTRPASFRPGQTIEMHRSRLPLAFVDEEGGFLNYFDGSKAPWLGSTEGTSEFWGGYMDAGDYDRRSQHLNVSYMLLDLYEGLPAPVAGADLGVPKSSSVLDPKIYAGTDGLPDLLHEAIWGVDFFRRLQLPSGEVLGGIESGGGPVHGQPSYLDSSVAFAFGPDLISSYRYALVAGKLARVLRKEGQAGLADLYESTALAAWKAGEKGFADPDAYFADAIALAASTGHKDGWASKRSIIVSNAREVRFAAAAMLYRLTGEPGLRKVFEETWQAGKLEANNNVADALWEYMNTEHPVDDSIRATARDTLLRAAKYVTDSQAVTTYPTLKHYYAPMGWGQGNAPDISATLALIRAHRMVANPTVLRAMLAGSAQILGANQSGLSFTLGLGVRNVLHPLHEDHFAMGVPAPRGITLYAWSTKDQVDFDWLFGPFWSALPEVADTRERADERQVEPNRWALPIYEFLIEHPLVIPQQEYTIHQTIGTTAAMWLYLQSVLGGR